MRKLFTFILTIVVLKVSLFAQLTNPLAGYYVTLAGDTVQTTLNQDSDLIISTSLTELKGAKAQTRNTISIEQIKAAGFDGVGVHYRVVEHEFTDLNTSTKKSERRLARVVLDEAEAELLELRVDGQELNKLYSDIPPYVYYLTLENSEQYRLDQVEVDVNQGKYDIAQGRLQVQQAKFKVDENYRGVLFYALRNWSGSRKRIEDMDLRKKPLLTLINDYLEDQYAGYVQKEDKTGTLELSHQFSAIGVNRLKLETDIAFTQGFGAAYTLRFHDPSIDNGLYIGLGLEYVRLFKINQEDPNSNTPNLDGHVLSLPLVGQYYFSQRTKIRPYLQGGMRASLSSGLINLGSQEAQTPTLRFFYGLGIDLGQLGISYQRGRSLRHILAVNYRI